MSSLPRAGPVARRRSKNNDAAPQQSGLADQRDGPGRNPMRAQAGERSAIRRFRYTLAAALVCTAAVICTVSAARGQSAGYPQKPVRVFVPYGPGGVGDLTMRLLADKLGQELKQQFVVENRPGAGGIVNMSEVMGARPDGYTLGEMGNGQAISMSLFQKLPYNVLTDFASVSVAASFEMLLAVPDKSPYRSLKDLVDAAQKDPGKINLGARQHAESVRPPVSAGHRRPIHGHPLSHNARPGDGAAARRCRPRLRLLRRAAWSDRSRQDPDHRHVGRAPQSIAQGRADRPRKRVSRLHRDQLERARRASEGAGGDRDHPQCRREQGSVRPVAQSKDA